MFSRWFLPLMVATSAALGAVARASEPVATCDPKQVVSSEKCARCHANETAVWKRTPHFQTFDALHRKPEAKAIAEKLGLASIKRSGECVGCHYTPMQVDKEVSLVGGVSCESCHGGAKNWIEIHNDYGGPGAKAEDETEEHAARRIHTAIAYGMRNPRNPYLVARSCLNCHTTPNERLVNVGGHRAGSPAFELVAWSQGTIKHNFVSNEGVNRGSDRERLRVMYVSGLIAELEFGARAVGKSTTKARFGMEAAERVAQAALKLQAVGQKVPHPLIDQVLREFAAAELKTNNAPQLDAIADRIRVLGTRFGGEVDGATLSAIDALLPAPSTYK